MVDWRFIANKYWKKVRWRTKNPPPEPEVWKVLSKIHGDIFVDVGANGGQVYTIPLHKNFKRVFAIEPNIRLGDRIRQRLEREHIKNVKIENFAVSDKNGYVTFWEDGSEASGSSTIVEDRMMLRAVARPPRQVRSIRLDDWWDGAARIALLKIDTEGADFRVLEGGKKVLSLTDHILVELHIPERRVELEECLSSYGFIIGWLDDIHLYGLR